MQKRRRLLQAWSCVMRHASCVMRHASCVMRHAACGMHHASCGMRYASCICACHAACRMRRVPCVIHASCVICDESCGTSHAKKNKKWAGNCLRAAIARRHVARGHVTTHEKKKKKTWLGKKSCRGTCKFFLFFFGKPFFEPR